jgi:hypothetical protein
LELGSRYFRTGRAGTGRSDERGFWCSEGIHQPTAIIVTLSKLGIQLLQCAQKVLAKALVGVLEVNFDSLLDNGDIPLQIEVYVDLLLVTGCPLARRPSMAGVLSQLRRWKFCR